MSGVFHVQYPRMKHEENSDHGDLEAIARHLTGSDHDWQKDADGIVWNTHWQDVFAHDGFHDPAGKLKKGDLLRTLHEDAIRTLRAQSHGKTYRIRTADEGIRHAAKVGLKRVYGEAKPGNGWTVADFKARKATARQAGIGLTVMTMDSGSNWRKILWMARLAGCRTLRLRTHKRVG